MGLPDIVDDDTYGIVDAIRDVRPDQIQAVSDLITDLKRQLAVATAVRDALDGGDARPAATERPTTKPKRPAKLPKPTASRNGQPRATAKAVAIAEYLLTNGALTADELAERLGWPRQAVAMTLSRGKRFFQRRDGGKYVVGPQLAKELESPQ